MVQRRLFPAVLLACRIGFLGGFASVAATQRPAANIVLQQVLLSESDDALTVTLVATGEIAGALKTTGSGESKRLYIDLDGVTSAVAPVTPVGHDALRQIRVALFSAHPLVTRVVLDVGTLAVHRLEPGATTRELRIVLESRTPRPAAPSAAPPYVDWFNAIERRVGILLQATSQARVTRDGGLPPLVSEWARVQREIESAAVPSAFAKSHALLLDAARLARLEAERPEAAPGAVSTDPSDATNPRVILSRARAALPTK
jgi:hypothetical protein